MSDGLKSATKPANNQMAKLLWVRFLVETSFRNLMRSPRRTLISLSAIACAAAAMLVFQSFVNGVKQTFRINVITSVYGHFQVSPKGFRQNESDDPLAYQISNFDEIRKAVEDIAPIKMFAPRQPFYGLVNFNDRSVGGIGFGVDAKEENKFLTLNQIYEGKSLADAGPESIVIGFALAKRLRVKVGDMVTVLVTTKTGSMNALDLEMVGTFKSGITELDQGTYQIDHNVVERLLKSKGAPIVVLGLQQDNEMPVKAALEKKFREQFPNLEIVHWNKLAEFFDNTMGWIEKQIFVFRTIILMIATLSIVTVFMMSLFERIGEFGTMRAIGTHRGSIAFMIFIESMVQSFVGSLIGVALAVAVITLGLRQGYTMPPPPLMSVPFHVNFSVPWADVPGTLLLCIFVAGGAGIFPALKMARIGIVEALGRNV